MEHDLRGVFRSVAFDERVALRGVKSLQLEIASMPPWACAMSVDAYERNGSDDRKDVERQCDEIFDDSAGRQCLQGARYRACATAHEVVPGLPVLH